MPPAAPPAATSAVFFDRDDTLIECRAVTVSGDLGDPARIRLRPGALDAVRSLRDAGYLIVTVSNQGGVARGSYTEEAVRAVNEELNRRLGGRIDAAYYCPWHPAGTVPEYTREHPWRKPAPGMLLQAASDLGIDLASSWLVGDAIRDCVAGRAAGCRTIYVPSEHSDNPRAGPNDHTEIDHRAPDLLRAAEIILRAQNKPK